MPPIGRQFSAKVLQFLLVNFAVFAAYRLFFIRLFGAPEALERAPAALLRGLGLDAALLALELCLLALLALVTRRLRLRATLMGLWVLTCINTLCAAFNLFVFRERHQHLWEIVSANIGRPYEMLIAFKPFVSGHPFVIGGSLLGLALAALAARRYTRPLAGQAVDLWRPAASFAEVDGTFTNNDGFVQRVRQSIAPVNQSKPDWMITAQLATELGMNFGFEMSSSAVFREIAERVPAYSGLRYPVLKDESNPLQAKYEIADRRDLSPDLNALRQAVEALPDTGEKPGVTPKVGHELFKIGTLTDKVPQFHLLAAGNPRPETVRVSPLYQITVDADLRHEVAATGD